MQFKLVLASMAFWATTALSTAAEEQCGSLGVMKVDASKLSASVDVDKIRQCANHPLAETPNRNAKRACWDGANFGCQGGYCWKRCNGLADIGPFSDFDLTDGKWCWVAANAGFGDWSTCVADDDCMPSLDENLTNCGQECDKCGCSC